MRGPDQHPDTELLDQLRAGLLAARSRGRFEVHPGQPTWVFDVAHNPQAAQMLDASLADLFVHGSRIAVCGMLDDKDAEGIVAPLDEHVDLWVALPADSPRAIPAGELARRIANATNRPCLIATSLPDALQAARREASEGDRILVAGSFYVVGPALQALGLYSPPKS